MSDRAMMNKLGQNIRDHISDERDNSVQLEDVLNTTISNRPLHV
jgi:hypothetical protein